MRIIALIVMTLFVASASLADEKEHDQETHKHETPVADEKGHEHETHEHDDETPAADEEDHDNGAHEHDDEAPPVEEEHGHETPAADEEDHDNGAHDNGAHTANMTTRLLRSKKNTATNLPKKTTALPWYNSPRSNEKTSASRRFRP